MSEDRIEGHIAIEQITVPQKRFRVLRPEAVYELAQSMSEVGQLQAIVIDETGELIIGWHRFEAAKKLGWTEILARICEDRSANQMRLMEIDENLVRADLSPAERAAHHAERKRLYIIEHPETTHGAQKGGRGNQYGANLVSRRTGELPPASPPPVRYTAEAAKTTKTPERTVQKEVSRGAIPNIISIAGTALDKAEELDALVKLPPSVQMDIMQRAKDGDKVSAKTTLKQINRNDKEMGLAASTIAASQKLGKQLYGVIYADPPWRFEPYSRDTGMDRAADNHYPTMDADAIANLEAPAAKDCALFMWATAPALEQALDVMAAWGFKYRTHIIWVKDRVGTGYWSRNRHELLLIGVKGDVPAPAPGTQSDSAITAPVEAHSVKPAVFAELIERLFPNTPRVEMFARSDRPGWDVWGNEAPSDE